MATQMQLRFYLKGITWPPGLLERKNNNKGVSFSALFFMFTLTWITEKELERVIENKGDEFRGKKNMEIQSSRWENEKCKRPARWKWAAVKNKNEHEHRKQNIG